MRGHLHVRPLGAGLALLSLVACGGGGGSAVPSTTAAQSVTAPTPAASAGASLTITLPAGPSPSPTPSSTPAGSPTALPTPLPPSVAGETPRMADAFVDALGVNVHMSYGGTGYAQTGAVASLLQNLGIRHVRDGVIIGDAATASRFRTLAAAGVGVDVISTEGTDPAALAAYVASLRTAIDAIEGPNEFDLSNSPTWAAQLDAFQASMYTAVKAATRLPVIGPSVSLYQSFAAAGTFTADADFGNMHDYFAGRNPGTRGWGNTDAFGTYGSLAWNLAIAQQLTPGRTMVATECGYTDGGGDQYTVPAAIKLHYTLRLFLEHWNANVARTYLYELIDEGGAPFSHYGIVDSTLAPKPVYTGLKSFIAHLADPGPAFVPAPLAYTIAGAVHHTLLQRRNGTYALVLWNEQPEWDPVSNVLLSPDPQMATIAFATAPRAIASTSETDAGASTSTSLAAQKTVTIPIAGMPTIVDITP